MKGRPDYIVEGQIIAKGLKASGSNKSAQPDQVSGWTKANPLPSYWMPRPTPALKPYST